MANAAEFVRKQRLEVDSASKEKVKQYATNALWIHPEIRGLMLEKHAKRVREMNDDEWEKYEEKKYHNPTPLGKSEIKPPETDFNKKDKESTNQYFSDRGIPPEA